MRKIVNTSLLFLAMHSMLFAGHFTETDSIDNSVRKVVYCVVALCDNATQGIVPVPAKLGNGNDANNNLYWGALYGVKSYFDRSEEWVLVSKLKQFSSIVLERCTYKHISKDVYLVADAYRGSEIETAIGRVVSFGYSQIEPGTQNFQYLYLCKFLTTKFGISVRFKYFLFIPAEKSPKNIR